MPSESLAARRHAEDSGFPVLAHGEAVAHGMLTALMLSAIHTGLDPRHIEEYRNDILEHHYNPLPFDADDIPQLVELMGHDKKNSAYGLPPSFCFQHRENLLRASPLSRRI